MQRCDLLCNDWRSASGAQSFYAAQQYSSNEVHMKALGILLKWGYGSLDSTKKSLNDKPKCEEHFIDPRATKKYA